MTFQSEQCLQVIKEIEQTFHLIRPGWTDKNKESWEHIIRVIALNNIFIQIKDLEKF